MYDEPRQINNREEYIAHLADMNNPQSDKDRFLACYDKIMAEDPEAEFFILGVNFSGEMDVDDFLNELFGDQ